MRDDQPQRLLQLASRLADLFDQYQVYRSDWLLAWEAGRDHLPGLPGQPDTPCPKARNGSPPLWRAVLADLTAQERSVTRPALRQQVLDALRTADIGSLPIARRVLLLGLTQVPLEMLEFLQAIARHSQVILGRAQPLPLPLGRCHRRARTAAPAAPPPSRTGGRHWPPSRWRPCTPTPTPCSWPGGGKAGLRALAR